MEQEEEEAEEEEVDGEEGVVEDTDAGGAEGDDSMMDDENINIKMEVPDDIAGSTERCYSSLLTLSSVLDAEVLLQAVGHKVRKWGRHEVSLSNVLLLAMKSLLDSDPKLPNSRSLTATPYGT